MHVSLRTYHDTGGIGGGAARVMSERMRRTSEFTALWTLGYGLYRFYYALGGAVGMPGTPASFAQWRRINGIAAVLLVLTAVLALVAGKTWERRGARPLLLALSWIIAVACVSHALIDIGQRLGSVAGAITIPYPFWRTIDRRAADLQDLLFNEPWFLVEGLLWFAIAWVATLRDSPRRCWWMGSAVAATIAATTVGLLTAFGVVGRVIVG